MSNFYHEKDRYGNFHLMIGGHRSGPPSPASSVDRMREGLGGRHPVDITPPDWTHHHDYLPPDFRHSIDVTIPEVVIPQENKVDLVLREEEETGVENQGTVEIKRRNPKQKKTGNDAADIYGKGMGATSNKGYLSDDEESDGEWERNDDGDVSKRNYLALAVIAIQRWVIAGYGWLHLKTRGFFIIGICALAYTAYFVVAMRYEYGGEGSKRLIWCSSVAVFLFLKDPLSKGLCFLAHKAYGDKQLSPKHQKMATKARFYFRWFLYFAVTIAMIGSFIEEGLDESKNVRAIGGLVVFIAIPMLFSESPGKINWHTVFWGVALQWLFAVGVLKWTTGRTVITWLQERFQEFFDNADAGSTFLFGHNYMDHFIIFYAIPIMFFMNSALTVLYYLGVMQWLIKIIGKALKVTLNTTPVESTCVATGVFLEGVTTVMVLRPYLPTLTKSELYAVIVSIYSSLGGAYMAILSAMGVSLEYLIPAMLISAPATFAVAKLMIPETKIVQNSAETIKEIDSDEKLRYVNAMDAAQTGALTMLSVVGNICVVLFAFYSFISWINHTLGWFGDRVGKEDVTIEYISSYILYPVALAMGVDPEDCRTVAMLLGYRVWIHNIFAFFELANIRKNGILHNEYMIATNWTGAVVDGIKRDDIVLVGWNMTLKNGIISERSEAIVTYCLCGFSSFLNVAVVSGIMFSLVPKRKKWIAKVAMQGLLAGNLANCLTGCFASIYYSK